MSTGVQTQGVVKSLLQRQLEASIRLNEQKARDKMASEIDIEGMLAQIDAVRAALSAERRQILDALNAEREQASLRIAEIDAKLAALPRPPIKRKRRQQVSP